MRRERATIRGSGRTGWMRILPGLFILALAACGNDHAPTKPPETAETLTSDGWAAFEKGEFARASELFGSAIVRDSLHAPAYVGDGWSRLELSADSTALRGALDRLDDAIRMVPSDPDAQAGRAAVLLALGADAAAVAEARALLRQQPTFVFSHATTFDRNDVLLIASSALVALGEFDPALDTVDRIEPSRIAPANPSTWKVDGVSYRTYPDALIAYLAKLSVQYAG